MLEERLGAERELFRQARNWFGRRELLLSLCVVTLAIAMLLAAAPAYYGLQEAKLGRFTPTAQLAGKNWRYVVDFPVDNPLTIQKLIECESQGLNIARTDSNGQTSWGILQFNGRSTWEEMERRFHFRGDPRNPSQAIHMADMMISNGLVERWSCSHSLGLAR